MGYDMGFGMFSLFDTLFPILFMVVFVIVIGVFVVTAVRSVAEWGRNNASPRLSSPATVVGKRERHYSHRNGGGGTTYYATFQFESGDRLELRLPDRDAGLLAEGDRGMLHFQGTRFLGFERQ